ASRRGSTNKMRAAMKDMMRATLQQQVEGKLAQMQTRLNLTPEQAEQARAILERQYSLGVGIAEKVMTGEASPADVAAQQNDLGNPEEELHALLTSEQLAAYAELQQEE